MVSPFASVAVAIAAAVALFSTTGVGVGNSWFDEQRLFLVATILVATLTAALCSGRNTGDDSTARVGLTALVAIGALSCLNADRPVAAFAEWAVIALLLSVAWLAWGTDQSTIRFVASAFPVTVGACYVAGVLAGMVSASMVGLPLGRDTFLVGFSNPRFPAQLQALTLPLLPLALAVTSHRGARIAIAAVFALWWMCVIGSGSRTAWLALAAAAVVMLWVGASGRVWLKLQAIFATAGAVLYLLIFYVAAPLLSLPVAVEQGRLGDTGSIAARWELAKIAVSMMRDSPWLGVGPMHFAYVDNGYGAHPHNVLLQLGAEWGLPAMLIFAVLASALLRRVFISARKRSTSEDGLICATVLASLVALSVGAQFDGYFVVPTSQAAAAIVLALAVAVATQGGEVEGRRVTRGRVNWLVLCFTMPALVMAVVLAFDEFGHPTQREARWRAEQPTAPFWPRFWQQGWIGPDSDPTAR